MENTKQVRIAKNADKEQFRQLWKTCFGDSDAFCHWLFEERFYPDHSVCLKVGEEMPSAMQGVPYKIRVREHIVDGAMLCGVSTHPKHRKKGYMGDIFRFEMETLQQKGLLLAVHTPAVLPSYFSFGHLPVADALYFEVRSVPLHLEKKGEYITQEGWKELFPLYDNEIAKKYSGAIVRSEDEFLRKCVDYSWDDVRCLILRDNEVVGYAFIYLMEKSLLCVEAVAKEGCYNRLVEAVSAAAEGRSVSIKLPPNVSLHLPFGETIRKQKGVAGMVNLSLLLKKLNIPSGYTMEISDHVLKENNGIFTLQGEKSESSPAFAVSAGHFLGVLLGYVSLYEIQDVVTIYDQNGFEEINKLLPKCNCYIIDEY